jgi:glycosyltransferase involved in cell wall biosynthesis
MASGVPVAAYPVAGPIDVVRSGVSGILHDDLAIAVAQALTLNREECRRYALQFSWERATQQFLGNLAPQNCAS